MEQTAGHQQTQLQRTHAKSIVSSAAKPFTPPPAIHSSWSRAPARVCTATLVCRAAALAARRSISGGFLTLLIHIILIIIIIIIMMMMVIGGNVNITAAAFIKIMNIIYLICYQCRPPPLFRPLALENARWFSFPSESG
jgi:hypothetical protein